MQNLERRQQFYDHSGQLVEKELEKLHGKVVEFRVWQYIDALGLFECLSIFADGFQLPSLRSKSYTQTLNHDSVSRHDYCPQTRQEAIRTDQRQRKKIRNEHLEQGGRPRSLKEVSLATPNRTRLLNGKLFTKNLLLQTKEGGIPKALQ